MKPPTAREPSIHPVTSIEDDTFYVKLSVHREGDVRGNYTTDFLLRFDDKENQLYIKRTIGNMEYEIPFENESEGIRKLIAVLPVVLIALKEGSL